MFNFSVASKFAIDNHGGISGKEGGEYTRPEREFDNTLNEMYAAINYCDGNDSNAVVEIINGWLGIKDTDNCRGVLIDGGGDLMDTNAIFSIKNVGDEADKESDIYQSQIEHYEPSEDEMNDLVSKIKSISVLLGDLTREFHSMSCVLEDRAESSSTENRKLKNNNKTELSGEASRQYSMLPFLEM